MSPANVQLEGHGFATEDGEMCLLEFKLITLVNELDQRYVMVVIVVD